MLFVFILSFDILPIEQNNQHVGVFWIGGLKSSSRHILTHPRFKKSSSHEFVGGLGAACWGVGADFGGGDLRSSSVRLRT